MMNNNYTVVRCSVRKLSFLLGEVLAGPRLYSKVARVRTPNTPGVVQATSDRARPLSVTVSSVVLVSSTRNLLVVKGSPTSVPVAARSEPSTEGETSDDRKTDEEHQWTTVQCKKNHGRCTTSTNSHHTKFHSKSPRSESPNPKCLARLLQTY